MENQIWIALTFIVFLLSFTLLGIYSATRKQDTTADYLLASRDVNPWLTGLSAMSTGQSGFLFIGQVGLAYSAGISAIWLVLGWALGDYIAWWLFFQKLRIASEESNCETVSAFLGDNLSNGRWISIVSGLITVALLGSYAAAQLVSGSKALNALFGWDYRLGIIIGAVIVVIYCFSGGIRASIWTDAAQAIIMIVSLFLLLVTAIISVGGFSDIWTLLAAVDPQLVNFSPDPEKIPFGLVPYLLIWMITGFGVVGQPHIMVRAMAINSAKNITLARNIKTCAGLLTAFMAIGIGMMARIILPQLSDPELALPQLALGLLPSLFVGLILAGLFSAVMSTADSQILSCSAAITQDIFPQFAKSYKFSKLGTISVTVIVLAIALSGNNNVFALVTFAWSVLSSSLGPLFIIKILKKPINTPVALLMMTVGIITPVIWNTLNFEITGKITTLKAVTGIYEVLPGMAAGFLVYLILQFFIKKSKSAIVEPQKMKIK